MSSHKIIQDLFQFPVIVECTSFLITECTLSLLYAVFFKLLLADCQNFKFV